GVASVLSLRAAVEEARGTLAAYDAEEQRQLCERHGLRFYRVELVDLAAPEPAALAAALRVIDDEVDAGRPIYVHCVAGVGRTGIVTAAWLVSRGMSGRAAADTYLHFAEEIAQRPGQKLAQAAYFVEKQLPVQWWGLLQIAAALGSPVAERPGDPIAERPPYADGWEAEYAARLRPWRERRAPE